MSSASDTCFPTRRRRPDHTVARTIGATRRFGSTVALDGVDLEVPAATITGLLGPNGAGKTTLLSLIVGLRRATGGQVELFGGSPLDATRRLELGTTPQVTGLPEVLRVGEVVRFVGSHYPDPVPTGRLLRRFGLTGLIRRQAGGLSGGQRRLLAAALAFVGRPRLVVLDEPTTGLDIDARQALWAAIREFHAEGGAVLLTSHHLEEIEQLAERIVVLDRGQVRAKGDLAQIKRLVPRVRVSFRAHGPVHVLGVPHVARDGDQHVWHTADADRVVRDLVATGVPFRDLQIQPASLEEAVVELTASTRTTDR